MELSPLVSKQKFVATWIQLKVVNLAVMGNSGLDLVESQVLDADGEAVKEIGDNFCWLTAFLLLLGVVETSRDHVWSHVLCSAGADHLVDSILDNGEFTSIEDHTDVRIGEIELLVTTASPWEFRKFARLEITQKEGTVSGCDQVSILINVNLGDLVSLG
jgi:hypothetical protein